MMTVWAFELLATCRLFHSERSLAVTVQLLQLLVVSNDRRGFDASLFGFIFPWPLRFVECSYMTQWHNKALSCPIPSSSKVHRIVSKVIDKVPRMTVVDALRRAIRKARRKEKDAVAAPQEESKLYLEQAVLECTVPESRLREVVDLPPGLDYNEWLASHTIAFFDHTNLVYGTISEFCTMSGCPDMNGPNGRQYLWFDEKGKKCKVAAPQYIDYVMTFTQRTLYDESIFPTKFDHDFPTSFESIVKKIQRLLFHVLAHIYHIHFKEIVLLNLHAHLNCLFSHFTLFNDRFKIVDEKETEILHDLAVALKLYGDKETAKPEEEAGSTTKVEGDEVNQAKILEKEPEKSLVAETDDDHHTSSASALSSAVIDTNQIDSVVSDSVRSSEMRPPVFQSQSSQSITSSITALHSRSSSGSHSSTGSCAMDSAMFPLNSSAASFGGSSPLKFQ